MLRLYEGECKRKNRFDMKQEQILQFIRDNAAVLTNETDSRILALSTCADANSVTRVVVFCYIKDNED